MKKIGFYFSFLFIFTTIVVSQTQVEWTNQLFAAKTETGKCFVFIYSDNFTFVNITSTKTNAVKILYNMDGLNDVFIAGKRFFTKRRETINVYDLDRLTNPENDGRKIDDARALRSQIDKVNNYSLYGDVIYYTRNNDPKVWKYTWEDNKKIEVEGVSINPGQDFSYVIYSPIKEQRNQEYRSAKNVINGKISTYQEIGQRAEDKNGIENAIKTLPKDRQNENGLYNAASPYLSGKYKLDKEVFYNFMMLAEITGNKNDAVSIISRLKGSSGQFSSYIDEFFNTQKILSGLTDSELTKRQNDHIKNKITPFENELKTNWGDKFDQKKSDFDRINANMNDYRWRENNSENIKTIDNYLRNFLKDTSYERKGTYDDWKLMGELFNVFDKRSGINLQRQETQQILERIEEALVEHQNTVFGSIKKDYHEVYKSWELGRNERPGIITKFESERTNAQNNKQRNLNYIITGIVSRYKTTELFNNINTNVFPGSYNPALIDFHVITDFEKIINGFKISGRIIMSDFMDNRNNAGEDYLLIKPSGYPLVNVNPESVFVLNSKKQISAFDTTKPDILQNNVEALTVNAGVFYLIQGANSQFIVTNAGELLQLSIKSGKIVSERMGTVTARDTVLVTEKKFYIFSQDRTVRNGSGQVSSFTIQACNDPKAVYTITINAKGFEVQ
jgi:hypothetical protein